MPIPGMLFIGGKLDEGAEGELPSDLTVVLMARWYNQVGLNIANLDSQDIIMESRSGVGQALQAS